MLRSLEEAVLTDYQDVSSSLADTRGVRSQELERFHNLEEDIQTARSQQKTAIEQARNQFNRVSSEVFEQERHYESIEEQVCQQTHENKCLEQVLAELSQDTSSCTALSELLDKLSAQELERRELQSQLRTLKRTPTAHAACCASCTLY